MGKFFKIANLEKYSFFGLGKKEPEDPKTQAERELQRYAIANQYVYSRAAQGGLSYGMRQPKDFDSDHYNRFIKETNADKKYAIMVEKYPIAKEWLGENGGDYFRQHGAGK